jgi:protein-S-isoprenylcysteine O-methyltransferase Ste14
MNEESPAGGFAAKGGGFVLAQFALMIAIWLAGLQWKQSAAWMESPLAHALAYPLMITGAVLGIGGVFSLGCNRTVFPRPLEKGSLVQTGIYSLVRHPLYSSLIALGAGWSIDRASWPALFLTAMLALLLDFKSRVEERWLRKKFPGYELYARRVKRLIPWIY